MAKKGLFGKIPGHVKKGPAGKVGKPAGRFKGSYGTAQAAAGASAHQAHITKVGRRPRRGPAKFKGGLVQNPQVATQPPRPNYSQ